MASSNVIGSVVGLLNDSLSKFGFEAYPLKIGWYNEVLAESFHLDYTDDTLAVVVLSTPEMFENAFFPFMENRGYQGINDPIDQCVKHYINAIVLKCFPSQKVDVSFDYEMLPSRKPKFLAQTAAHVAGAAFYYQQSDITDQPWGAKKMFGVCVHPRFGGWFAIRALLVFGGVELGSELEQPIPPDCVPSREGRIQLLEDFNYRWKDFSYRDIVTPVQTYSQKQMEYFVTPPAQRFALLKAWGLLPSDNSQSPSQSDIGGHG